jgi:6-phosphogluconate dehydrogenase
LIAETYDLMKRSLGLNDDELHDVHSAWLPANLIQAQRDYFGAHTYERIDAKGTFHTEWEKN